MKPQTKAYLLSLVAVLFWSTIGSAFKITLRYVSFIEILLYSSFIACVILLINLAFNKKIHLLLKTSSKDILRSALYGFLNPFLYYMILIKAYDLLLAQEAVALNYTWPLALVLLSIPVLKQKISYKSIIALFISFFGILIVISGGNVSELKFDNALGVSMALFSSIIWASFWLLNLKDKRDEVPKLILNFFFGFIYTLIAAIITDSIRILPIEGYLGVTYIGFFELGLTFAIWLKALKLSSTTAKVSNLIYISPFMSLIFVAIIVGEKIDGASWIGLIFIISGILLQQFISRKQSQNI
ncbi:DMT family transporter [Bacteroidota bacterium]